MLDLGSLWRGSVLYLFKQVPDFIFVYSPCLSALLYVCGRDQLLTQLKILGIHYAVPDSSLLSVNRQRKRKYKVAVTELSKTRACVLLLSGPNYSVPLKYMRVKTLG